MTTALEPIRKQIAVPLAPDRAFELFTEGMGSWWPMATHSVAMDTASSCRMETKDGGRVLEDLADGSVATWGTITAWDPPRRLVFTWHPGGEPDTATEVAVNFAGNGDVTTVELVHSGWEARGDMAAQMRAAYVDGWDLVLGDYAGAAG